ncbi:hypothetical protein MMC13_001957 [Lambiella insularis]|nr:hypothetical protein [Lambiella insularis]
MDDHNRAVAVISDQARGFFQRKESFRIYHGSTTGTRPSLRRRDRIIDTSKLNHVLMIDTQAKRARVEPNVTMKALLAATLKHGLFPPVVMEMPQITAGGGFSDHSGQSGSFRYGFFDRIVESIEIVLGDGEIVSASRSENLDLLRGAAGSLGTLGIVTLLEVQLIEAATYVALTYYPIHTLCRAIHLFKQFTEDPSCDFLDGYLLDSSHGVVCSGRLTNHSSSPRKVQRFSRAIDPWFYMHATEVITTSPNRPTTELVPLEDYLFRHDRSGFWLGEYAFQYFKTPCNRVTRWLLDYFMHCRIMCHAFHVSGFSHHYIVQDVGVPYASADDFHQYLQKSIRKYPLWLAPITPAGKDPRSPHDLMYPRLSDEERTVLLFGIYGPGPERAQDFVSLGRSLERKVASIDGRKALYAHSHYTEEEFWKAFGDRDKYEALRAKYHATSLPTIYEKVKTVTPVKQQLLSSSWIAWILALVFSTRFVNGLYGVYKAVRGGDYLLDRPGAL